LRGDAGAASAYIPQPGINVCRRVFEVVEAADVVFERTDLS